MLPPGPDPARTNHSSPAAARKAGPRAAPASRAPAEKSCPHPASRPAGPGPPTPPDPSRRRRRGRRGGSPAWRAGSSPAGAAAPARALPRGGARCAAAPTATRSTGAGRSPGFGDPARSSCWWAWHRPRTAATAPAHLHRRPLRRLALRALSGPGSPTSRPPRTAATAAAGGAYVHRRGPLRAAGQPAEPRGAGELPPYLAAELAAAGAARVSSRSAAWPWDAVLRVWAEAGHSLPRPRPRFGHGAEVCRRRRLPVLLGVDHPSQQNTSRAASPSRCSTPSSRRRELLGARRIR